VRAQTKAEKRHLAAFFEPSYQSPFAAQRRFLGRSRPLDRQKRTAARAKPERPLCGVAESTPWQTDARPSPRILDVGAASGA